MQLAHSKVVRILIIMLTQNRRFIVILLLIVSEIVLKISEILNKYCLLNKVTRIKKIEVLEEYDYVRIKKFIETR